MRFRSFSLATVALVVASGLAHAAQTAAPPDAAPGSIQTITAEHDAAARTLLQKWLTAQNEGDFYAYFVLYAKEFGGERREGSKTLRFGQGGWMSDREPMFKKSLSVRVEEVRLASTSNGVEISFTEHLSLGSEKRLEGKKMLVRPDAKGVWRIFREDLLPPDKGAAPDCDKIVHYEREDDLPALKILYPGLKYAQGKSEGPKWTFEVTSRTEVSLTSGTLEVFTWNENYNPGAEGAFQEWYYGGVVVLGAGKILFRRNDQPARTVQHVIHKGNMAVVVLKFETAFHGENIADLEIWELTKSRFTRKTRKRVQYDDADGRDSFEYKADVEYKDVDGNGVEDVVITPVTMRNVARLAKKLGLATATHVINY